MKGQQRVRTESMVERLSKKPISEGFELWDKGYVLGAIRLFQYKIDTSPPFQVAACYDALGELLLCVDETYDAADTFKLAAERYRVIQNPLAAQLMHARIAEINEGPAAARAMVSESISNLSGGGDVQALLAADAKTKTGAARLFTYRAQLCLKDDEGVTEDIVRKALADADAAITIGWDRVHSSHVARAELLLALDSESEEAAAMDALQSAIASNKSHVPAYMMLIPLQRKNGQLAEALELCDEVMKIHPSCAAVREKALVLSDMTRDDDALQLLDVSVQKPPHDEMEAHMGVGASVSLLHKTRCIILADQEKMIEAADAASCALAINPKDEEARRLYDAIVQELSTEYLERTQIPSLLDRMVQKALENKPRDVVSFLLREMEAGRI